jgi:hypothetical protein
MKSVLGPLAITLAFTAACGGETPPPAQPQNVVQQPTHEDDGNSGPQISNELGSIDPDASDKLIKSLYPKFDSCQRGRLGDVPVISGKFSFKVRVGQDGKPKWFYFEDSEIGDRDTEQCIADVVMNAPFPQPVGGEAEVEHSTQLLLPQDTRPPVAWDPDKMAQAVSDAASCKSGSWTAHVTAIVKADNSNRKQGDVVSVGVALPQQDADGAIECIVKAVKGSKIPSPGGYYAKVSFSI